MLKFKQRIVDKYEKETLYVSIILTITILLLSGFLLKDGLIKGGDLEFHINRIYQIAENIKTGDILSLTYSADTYGYGTGIFYPQIFLYIPAILIVLGVDIIVSYKIFIFVCNIANVIVTYICVYKLMKNKKVALVTSVLYSTCCYRFAVTYWISAMGTLEAFIFIPVVVLGLYEILYGDAKKWYILVIGITGLIYSHLISFVLIVVFLCLPLIILNIKSLIKEKERIKYLLYSIILTILLTAAFILPFLQQIIKYDFYLELYTPDTDMTPYTVPFPFNIIGVYDVEYNEQLNENVFGEMGCGFIIFLFSTIFIILNKKQKKITKEKNKYINLLYIIAFVYVFAISIKTIWEYVGIFKMLQFQYRFQLINSFVFSFIAACILEMDSNKKYLKEMVGLLMYLSITFNFYYTYDYLFNEAFVIYDVDFKSERGSGKEYVPGAILDLSEIENLPKGSNKFDFIFESEKNYYILKYWNNKENKAVITLPLYYYEGYDVLETTSEKNNIPISQNGYVELNLNGEKGEIKFKYNGTYIMKIGYVITLVTYIVIVINAFNIKQKR